MSSASVGMPKAYDAPSPPRQRVVPAWVRKRAERPATRAFTGVVTTFDHRRPLGCAWSREEPVGACTVRPALRRRRCTTNCLGHPCLSHDCRVSVVARTDTIIDHPARISASRRSVGLGPALESPDLACGEHQNHGDHRRRAGAEALDIAFARPIARLQRAKTRTAVTHRRLAASDAFQRGEFWHARARLGRGPWPAHVPAHLVRIGILHADAISVVGCRRCLALRACLLSSVLTCVHHNHRPPSETCSSNCRASRRRWCIGRIPTTATRAFSSIASARCPPWTPWTRRCDWGDHRARRAHRQSWLRRGRE
jgi:hypothetical protein